MRPNGKPEILEKRRRLAVHLLKSGHSYRSVAVHVRSSLSSIVRWYQEYRQQGWKGLRPKPTPGRPSRLSLREKQELVEILTQGPLKAGYTTDLWTLRRIGEVIRKRFGVRYTLPNIWQLMQALGWSCQKPETRARERNETRIRSWKRRVWPRIKKNSRA